MLVLHKQWRFFLISILFLQFLVYFCVFLVFKAFFQKFLPKTSYSTYSNVKPSQVTIILSPWETEAGKEEVYYHQSLTEKSVQGQLGDYVRYSLRTNVHRGQGPSVPKRVLTESVRPCI